MKIETDPIKLWVPPDSDVIQQKNHFDSTFGPFYRVEQIIISLDHNQVPKNTSLFDPTILRKVVDLQTRIQNTVVEYEGQTITWDSLCFKPVPGKGCLVESISEYFSYDNYLLNCTDVADVMVRINDCLTSVNVECRGTVGSINFPYVVFGGYPPSNSSSPPNYLASTALVVTYLLNNEPSLNDPADAWEKQILKVIQQGERGLHFSYMLQNSVTDELARSTSADIPTVILSYAIMFLYISFSLGRVYPFNTQYFFVRTKFLLGFSAILIVICSMIISLGLCSAFGVEVTPIISEVIPFLVLAIGIDNVFIILNNFQSRDPRMSIEDRLVGTLSEVGLSITLASISEAFAFFLGSMTKMPAVQAFAFYSGAAILADYLLQLTCFCAIVALDAKRKQVFFYY